MATGVRLQDVSCTFKTAEGEVNAVDHVNLTIKPGEFFTLLGPSGSGKTTCLRMIGGFTLPTSGQIYLGDQEVSQLPPYKRPVNTVFQDYALFPHMSVVNNVAYGLMVRGIEKKERIDRAYKMLDLVQLAQVGERKPAQLSGGQRQRVALARALINKPEVLLLDEPLGALDLKLREQMQAELKSLQRQLGITFLFITHDQHEALSMSDRVGVFNKGRLEQVGSPEQIYNSPATQFVAEFIGAANIIEGQMALEIGNAQALIVRPEQISIVTAGNGKVSGKVIGLQYFGSFIRIQVQTALSTLQADLSTSAGQSIPNVGDTVCLNWQASAMHTLR